MATKNETQLIYFSLLFDVVRSRIQDLGSEIRDGNNPDPG
jgi:hypothetical protein